MRPLRKAASVLVLAYSQVKKATLNMNHKQENTDSRGYSDKAGHAAIRIGYSNCSCDTFHAYIKLHM